MARLRDESRKEFSIVSYPATFAEIQTGAIQRIADATELMAKNYRNLQLDAERYQKWYRDKYNECESLKKTLSGMRGQVGRLLARARKAEGRS